MAHKSLVAFCLPPPGKAYSSHTTYACHPERSRNFAPSRAKSRSEHSLRRGLAMDDVLKDSLTSNSNEKKKVHDSNGNFAKRIFYALPLISKLVLAAARSQLGSDSRLDCHSLPRCRFATLCGENANPPLLRCRKTGSSDQLQIKNAPWGVFYLEQATGIEPAQSAWEAEILPLNYACGAVLLF